MYSFRRARVEKLVSPLCIHESASAFAAGNIIIIIIRCVRCRRSRTGGLYVRLLVLMVRLLLLHQLLLLLLQLVAVATAAGSSGCGRGSGGGHKHAVAVGGVPDAPRTALGAHAETVRCTELGLRATGRHAAQTRTSHEQRVSERTCQPTK